MALILMGDCTDQRPRPNEKKTGARYRKITDFARRKKGKEENSFHRKRLCLLTCLLMGDPDPDDPFKFCLDEISNP
jgi:hypothetical protein